MHTRIAPTPSGYLHIGNVCSFLLTRQLADQYEGTVRLRIDDIDNSRIRPEYLDDIFQVLRLLEFDYDYGPTDLLNFQKEHTQHLRLPLYHALLANLKDTRLVYACTRSRKQLLENSGRCSCRRKNIPLEAEGVACRIYVPPDTIITFEDNKLGTQRIELAKELPDFIVQRRDGLPAYQVISLADDLYYETTYIVRGSDLLTSSAAQLYLA